MGKYLLILCLFLAPTLGGTAEFVSEPGVCAQALQLPKTFAEIRRLVREHFTREILDANLRSFHAFFTEPDNLANRMRPWNKVPLGDIKPSQIERMKSSDFVGVLQFAMEVEEPTQEYSLESGRAFQVLIPSIARFMGKTPEQDQFSKEHQTKWCESPWCAEEHRHAAYWARLLEALTGQAPERKNGNTGIDIIWDESAAIEHLYNRQSSEWMASSTYVFLSAHANGPLKEGIQNVLRDEVKHLVIMSALDKYLFGPNPGQRTRGMLNRLWKDVRHHRTERSNSNLLTRRPVLVTGFLYTMIQIEKAIRAYVQTLPVATLRDLFEVDVELQPLGAAELSTEARAKLEADLAAAKASRISLARWRPRDRAKGLAELQAQPQIDDKLQP